MKQHELEHVVGINADGTPYDGFMIVANYGTTKKADGPWDLCSICGSSFPKSELRYVRGKPYCTKNRCIEDTMPKDH